MTIKKYKIHFSLFNLFSDTQTEVVKLQTYVKGVVAAITGATWYESNATYALYVGMGGIILDTLLACFYFEQITTKTK